MRITPDTNVLVRAAVNDDPEQGRQARQLLGEAEHVALTLPAMCELVWVLTTAYKRRRGDIATSVRTLITAATVHVDRAAVEAGLAVLDAGGDFADGLIAFEGRRLGGPVFASFDRRATDLIRMGGGETCLLGGQESPP